MVIPNRIPLIFLVSAIMLCCGYTPQSAQAADEGAAKEEAPADQHEEGAEEGHGHEHGDEEHGEAHSSEGGESHDSHGDEEKGGGMEFKADTALWSLVTFLVFIFVLRMFAWGPLVEGLDGREAHFRNQLAEAEAARIQAEKMLRDHAAKLEAVQDEVKAIIDEAKRDAEHTKNDIIEQAQKEAQSTQDRAIHEIERSKDAALKELFDTVSSQVSIATEHVIGRSIDGEDQSRLINEALSQFSSQ